MDIDYKNRLEILILSSMKTRREKADLIMTFKILHQITDLNKDRFFKAKIDKTRGHTVYDKLRRKQ